MKDCSRTAEHSAVQTPGCRMRRIVSLQCSLTHPNTNPRCFPPVQHHASKDLTWPRRAQWSSHVWGTETWVADERRRCLPLLAFAPTINFSNGREPHISGLIGQIAVLEEKRAPFQELRAGNTRSAQFSVGTLSTLNTIIDRKSTRLNSSHL